MTSTAGAPPGSGLVRQAVAAITRRMSVEALGPGDRLPSEAQLSRELEVSRTVVREALHSLAAMRLIDLRTGKRATVAELDYGSLSPLMEHGVGTEQITVQQVYDARRTIERRTSALAALRRDAAAGDRILELALGMREAVRDPPRVMELDLELHRRIAEAAGNPVFSLIIGAFDGITRQTWPIGWRSRESDAERGHMIDIHVDLAEAVVAGDPVLAAGHMARHFDHSVRALLTAGIA